MGLCSTCNAYCAPSPSIATTHSLCCAACPPPSLAQLPSLLCADAAISALAFAEPHLCRTAGGLWAATPASRPRSQEAAGGVNGPSQMTWGDVTFPWEAAVQAQRLQRPAESHRGLLAQGQSRTVPSNAGCAPRSSRLVPAGSPRSGVPCLMGGHPPRDMQVPGPESPSVAPQNPSFGARITSCCGGLALFFRGSRGSGHCSRGRSWSPRGRGSLGLQGQRRARGSVQGGLQACVGAAGLPLRTESRHRRRGAKET